MNPSLSTSTAFYAGVNQPVPSATYMWAPLVILSAGIIVLVMVLAYVARTDRTPKDNSNSLFD